MSGHARLTLAGALACALAALSLGTVLEGAWMWDVAVVIAVVVGAGAIARRVGMPPALVPVVSVAALLVHITVRFTHEQALLWVVPTPEAARAFGGLLNDGGDAIAVSNVPAPVTPGLLMITVIGVGLAAVAVDTLVVTYRRAALSGLALLALYTVPSSLSPTGVGWGAFVLGGLGYLIVLLVDAQDRISRWGRGARRDQDRSPESIETRQLLPGARRVGAAALTLGVVVPLVLPGLSQPLLPWSTGTGPGSGRGPSVVVDNPILDLREDLVRPANRQVLRYTTDDTAPGYLRVVTLDSFNGDTWSPSKLRVPNSHDVNDGLPLAPGLDPSVPSTPVRSSIEIVDLRQRWLPLPYPSTQVTIDGLWLYDDATFNVFSTKDNTQGLRYEVTSLDLDPSADMLRAATPISSGAMQPYVALPGELPDSVHAIAAEVTAGASTNYDKAVALQNWLRAPENFRYDTSAPDGTGLSAIEAFLTRRSGFCVHFASTMAVMARTLGIPARVDVGFTRGRVGNDGSWSVTLHDAHAWPELYFDGVGWVPFEPTPAVRTGEPPAYTRSGATTPDNVNVPSASASATSSAGPGSHAGGPGDDARRRLLEEQGASGAASSGTPVPWVALLSITMIVLVAASPFLTRLLLRRRRLTRRPDTAAWARDVWRELRDSARDLGYAWPPSQTPRQAAARIVREGRLHGEEQNALVRLGSSAERARYAPSVGEVGDLGRDYRTVMRSLRARRSRSTRLRARLAPPTVHALIMSRRSTRADLRDAQDLIGRETDRDAVLRR